MGLFGGQVKGNRWKLGMKKIDKLVLKAFWGPFILTFVIVIFIFLLRLVLFYFSDLFGKDLGAFVYAKLFFYFTLITVPLAMPLSILVSSLMTFGRLGENFELTALKSAGISILRVFRPILIFTFLLCGFMFWFSNYALPWSNLKGWSLLYDIKTTKTTLNIKEGIFYTDLPGYAIQVGKKYPDNKSLKDVLIYDHTSNDGNRHVTLADSALMYTILNKKYLVFELFNGRDYLEDADRGSNMNYTDVAVHKFKRSKVIMSLSAFDLQKTEENQFAHHEIMRNSFQLESDMDSIQKGIVNIRKGFVTAASPYFMFHGKPYKPIIREMKHTRWVDSTIKKYLPVAAKKDLSELALQQAKNMLTFAQSNQLALQNLEDAYKKTKLEWHHKFTNALAILVMFLIGAPLGAIIKKGGFGVPMVVAIAFFILMYVLSQQGDKMAKEGRVLVQIGAWISNTCLALVGFYFLRISLNDARLFDSDWYAIQWNRAKNFIKKTPKPLQSSEN